MADDSWIHWYTARTISFPTHARDAPERCLYSSNSSGATQLFAWDRERGLSRQLTHQAHGALLGSISPDGRWIWWFADADGNEQGGWIRQPFDVDRDHPGEPIGPELAPGARLGLALGRTSAFFGLSRDEGTTIYRWREGESPTVLFESETVAWPSALSYDETLLAITHTELSAGDTFSTAVRVVRVDPAGTADTTGTAATVAELWDGRDRGLEAAAFAPVDGDQRLILHHHRFGVRAPLVWDPEDGGESQPHLRRDGDSAARWYPDATALLVRTQRHGRDRLARHDLADGSVTELAIPDGCLGGYAIRPGTPDRLEFEISSGGAPGSLRDQSGSVFLPQPDQPPASVALTDAWVPGPGGTIHALVARASDGPAPTIVVLHGGPGDRVTDSFWPLRAAFVQQGYTVVHVNYRGSSGYGTEWQHANRTQPGLVELEDVAAVRNWLVQQGITDPDRCVLSGISWGGYLTLLGLGTQPELWSAGIADVPIGDLVALYEDEIEPVREADRSLFGGSPDELPRKWARSSPITYAERVRAPLLVLAGRNDVRCPFRQVRNYLDRLDELDTPYEFYEFGEGHLRLVVEEQIRQVRRQLAFLSRHVPTGP